MPDTWRCECGYTNLGSKTCLVCRRPRQAVPAPEPEARIDEPPPAEERVEKKAARPKAAAKKRPVRKKAT
ncbi:MAG: hypothetical protein JO086_16980 [Acidimicrobiia bacterium]|nr:hypothetical protein [Acidimicrobiia bacterium]